MGYARRLYLRRLAQHRVRLLRSVGRQRDALLYLHPEPDQLWSLVASYRLWERRFDDADFAVTRVGVGPQSPATALIAPDTKPLEQLEPLSALALRRFLTTYARSPSCRSRWRSTGSAGYTCAATASAPCRWSGRCSPNWPPCMPRTTYASRSAPARRSSAPGTGSSGCRTPCTRSAPTRSARCGWSPRPWSGSRRCWRTCWPPAPGSTRTAGVRRARSSSWCWTAAA